MTDRPTSVSLLYRVRDQTDEASWSEFAKLYYGLVDRWLRAQGVTASDADDVTQEVMVFVSKEIGAFEHNGRQGAFRNWLRQITSNRMREHWRKRDRRKQREGPDLGDMADALADDRSDVSRIWNIEHDRCVLGFLLTSVSQRFQESSVQAFRKVAIEQRPAEEVADELGMSVGAIRVAQSRVLRALREIGDGLVD